MNLRLCLRWILCLGLLSGSVLRVRAQETPDSRTAREILQTAVKTELDADRNDHSRWRYRDDQKDLGTASIVVETDHGSVKRLIERGGHPLSTQDAAAEDARLRSFIHDSSALAKQKRDGQQDGKQARDLLVMLPDAFTWQITSQDAEKVTMHFQPNPKFSPPNIQARVLGAMEGTLVVDRKEHRITTLSGRLMQDVTIGWGILGRLREGGTFHVERRQVGPNLWQITETHVHIDGKVLFFKSIGQQQDEVQTEFTQVPPGTTLEQALELSKTLK